jgi:hypothetical protein
MDTKKRIEAAIKKYVEKNTESTKKHRKNDKPEKRVEKAVMAWCKEHNWYCNVIEAKATFNEKLGRYIGGMAKAGHVDISGTTNMGIACFIELKAPGKLSTLRPNQYDFLIECINRNAFGVCVDSAELLEQVYVEYLARADKKEFLISLLKRPASMDDDRPLFD